MKIKFQVNNLWSKLVQYGNVIIVFDDVNNYRQFVLKVDQLSAGNDSPIDVERVIGNYLLSQGREKQFGLLAIRLQYKCNRLIQVGWSDSLYYSDKSNWPVSEIPEDTQLINYKELL